MVYPKSFQEYKELSIETMSLTGLTFELDFFSELANEFPKDHPSYKVSMDYIQKIEILIKEKKLLNALTGDSPDEIPHS